MMTVLFKSILIVEDEMLIAMDAEDSLETAGHGVAKIARTVSEAMRALQDNQVDAALLDFNLPDGTSAPIARWLQEHGVPFAIVTSQSPNQLSGEGLPHSRIYQKPSDYAAIAQELAEAA
ncbi:response regulator [Notoacmeibacter sp. MSK16QG-6]|uniref:response regulator n=1 Tax=Notoacmeibacter sp. MSK16QG-6 TaxID=2957982 RepID=UPI00209F5A45|nr:response regulator [Notoacmeibacter sp. MSK16QG-6]MCP1200215.1 response regulator [Notoacmeibacter sp. MSK16QG-6]